MLFYTTTNYLPIFFVGGTKGTEYEPSKMFYDEYRDMKELYAEEVVFDWINYGEQLVHIFNSKNKLNWTDYGLDYIKSIKVIDFEMNDHDDLDKGIACFHLKIDTILTSNKILSILKEIKENDWIKEYYKSKYRIMGLDHFINTLPKRMNSTQHDVSMKAWADFIILYETFKEKGIPFVFNEINGDMNEMIRGFEFTYPGIIIEAIPDGAAYYLDHRYEGDILYHKAKDVLGWNAWPEDPGADHLLEFFLWCVKRGYNTMDKVNELINKEE